jgi:hypothetical protein
MLCNGTETLTVYSQQDAKHKSTEQRFRKCFCEGETHTLLGPLEKANRSYWSTLSNRLNRVGISHPLT